VRLKKQNPRREGTAGFHAWNLLRKGMTVDEYLAAGGRRDHLRWDIDKGNCKLVDRKGKTTEMPAAPKHIFAKGSNGVAVVRTDDSKVKTLHSTRRWRVEHEWKHGVVKFKDGGELKHMMGRECTLRTFISPKGNRYVQATGHEPADIIVDLSKHGLPNVRLRKEVRSAVVKKHVQRVKKETKEAVGRKQAKAKKQPTKKVHLKSKKRKS
jgi:hypothetical protein